MPPSALELEARLRAAGFEPPLDSELDAGDLAALRDAGRAIRVTRTLHYHPDAIAAVKQVVVEAAARGDGAITIAQLRDRASGPRGSSRRRCSSISTPSASRFGAGDQHFVRARRSGG